MLRFFYDTNYKYTNRSLIDVSGDTSYRDVDYVNIDSPDTINGHIIYKLESGENVPTYIVDQESGRRYFVSGITPLSANKKYQISLIRDILSESDTWKYEDAYIEAGTATDYNKYKRWNLPFTNTKVREERLNFGGKSSFFVFYVNEQHINNHVITEDDLEISMSDLEANSPDATVSTLSAIPSYQYINAGTCYRVEDSRVEISILFNDDYVYTFYVESNGLSSNYTRIPLVNTPPPYAKPTNFITIAMNPSDFLNNTNNCQAQLVQAIQTNVISTNEATITPQITSTAVNNLSPYTDKLIYIEDVPTKLYMLDETLDAYWAGYSSTVPANGTLTSAIRNINFPTTANYVQVLGTKYYNYDVTGSRYAYFRGTKKAYNYVLNEVVSTTSFSFNFIANKQTGGGSTVLPKLPKSAVRCVNILEGAGGTDKDAIAKALMMAQQNGGSLDNNTGQIIDIQYLPFSIATTSDSNSNIVLNNVNQYARFLETDDFEFFTNLSDLTEINKETDTIKLVSPSRSSQFIFRPYNNDGNMEFQTKVTIKPFASTIYVRPSTKGLLEYDWDDKDGLIINEDFSLTKVSSAWAEYIRSNKNYERIFNREMKGREYERGFERELEKAYAKSDEYVAKNLQNEYGRNTTGNIPIVSTVAGLFSQGLGQIPGTDSVYNRYMAAAATDRYYNEMVYRQSMDQARDLFNLQLENIKAQAPIPSTITTIDCKLLDGIYIEYYSTNETELNAIALFYFNNGNRIDSYGTFNNYYGGYVKGRLIRAMAYTQPEIEEVNRRLSLGIYTGGY